MPKFPCPTCDAGHLHLVKDSLGIKEPVYSVESRKEAEWEFDWERERFYCVLDCDVATCGEYVVVSGDTTYVEVEDDERRYGMMCVLRPRSMFPAPPIIDVPKEAPSSVSENIGIADQLFWADLAACANRLRISVEFLLDHFGVPREALNKYGEMQRLDLNGRIDHFKKTDKDHADTMTALRMIGNLGSHGAEVKREALLDAYEIYEDSLAELCGQRKKRLEALKQKIIATKGMY
jgi:hypothetical protein